VTGRSSLTEKESPLLPQSAIQLAEEETGRKGKDAERMKNGDSTMSTMSTMNTVKNMKTLKVLKIK
jgi:hypothetical protein